MYFRTSQAKLAFSGLFLEELPMSSRSDASGTLELSKQFAMRSQALKDITSR